MLLPPTSFHRTGTARLLPAPSAPVFRLAPRSVLSFCRSLAVVAVLAICVLATAPKNAHAGYFSCGVATHLPSSPTIENEDRRFTLWKSWGEIKVSPTVTFQIPVGFSPIPNYQNSRLLGAGWSFPLLESALFAINDRQYELRFPTGHRMILDKTKKPGHLENWSWKAVTKGKITIAKSTCGWTLTFDDGRLKKLKTPDGAQMEFLHDNSGKHWITLNGRTVLTFKNEYDHKTTRRIAHLTLQDKRHALLRFAHRPAIVEILENNPASKKPKKIQRPERVETLASVQWDGQRENQYNFKTDELELFLPNIARQPWGTPKTKEIYQWDLHDGFLKKDNNGEYSILLIDGIRCLKKIFPDGKKISIHGENKDRSKQIVKEESSTEIFLVEKFFAPHTMHGKIKKRFRLSESGAKELVENCIYNENEVLTKHLLDGQWISYSPAKDEAKDAKTGALIWRKKRDAKGRITEFISGVNHYNIDYSDATATVSILTPDNTLREKINLPTSEIQKIIK